MKKPPSASRSWLITVIPSGFCGDRGWVVHALRSSAYDVTPVSGIHPPIRRGHLDVQSECSGHRIHLVVHSEYPVLNWRKRKDSEHRIEFGEGV